VEAELYLESERGVKGTSGDLNGTTLSLLPFVFFFCVFYSLRIFTVGVVCS